MTKQGWPRQWGSLLMTDMLAIGFFAAHVSALCLRGPHTLAVDLFLHGRCCVGMSVYNARR